MPGLLLCFGRALLRRLGCSLWLALATSPALNVPPCPPALLQGARFGVVSMCIGSGMGAAAVFERGGEIDQVAHTRTAGAGAGLSRDARV